MSSLEQQPSGARCAALCRVSCCRQHMPGGSSLRPAGRSGILQQRSRRCWIACAMVSLQVAHLEGWFVQAADKDTEGPPPRLCPPSQAASQMPDKPDRQTLLFWWVTQQDVVCRPLTRTRRGRCRTRLPSLKRAPGERLQRRAPSTPWCCCTSRQASKQPACAWLHCACNPLAVVPWQGEGRDPGCRGDCCRGAQHPLPGAAAPAGRLACPGLTWLAWPVCSARASTSGPAAGCQRGFRAGVLGGARRLPHQAAGACMLAWAPGGRLCVAAARLRAQAGPVAEQRPWEGCVEVQVPTRTQAAGQPESCSRVQAAAGAADRASHMACRCRRRERLCQAGWGGPLAPAADARGRLPHAAGLAGRSGRAGASGGRSCCGHAAAFPHRCCPHWTAGRLALGSHSVSGIRPGWDTWPAWLLLTCCCSPSQVLPTLACSAADSCCSCVKAAWRPAARAFQRSGRAGAQRRRSCRSLSQELCTLGCSTAMLTAWLVRRQRCR